MQNLFAYGTLMCDEIMRRVSGRYYPSMTGHITGYARLSVRGETYPALVRSPDSQVEGMFYQNIPGLVWKRLDHFEGAMYRREHVQVRLANGRNVSAETYVCRPEYQDRLVDLEWDFTDFLHQGKSIFVNQS